MEYYRRLIVIIREGTDDIELNILKRLFMSTVMILCKFLDHDILVVDRTIIIGHADKGIIVGVVIDQEDFIFLKIITVFFKLICLCCYFITTAYKYNPLGYRRSIPSSFHLYTI